MLNKIEKGQQLGLEKRIFKDGGYVWYSYAVQKKNDVYYTYECEIKEENMAAEIYEFENIFKYSSLDEVKENFPHRYETLFSDIQPLKGSRIFNAEFYA